MLDISNANILILKKICWFFFGLIHYFIACASWLNKLYWKQPVSPDISHRTARVGVIFKNQHEISRLTGFPVASLTDEIELWSWSQELEQRFVTSSLILLKDRN